MISSGSKKRRRRGPPRGEARLAELIPRVYPTDEPDELRLIRAIAWWQRHVPPRIARSTRPAVLRAGALVIHTTTSAWAQELTMLLPNLATQLAAAVPGIAANRIRARAGPLPPVPSRTRSVAKTVPPLPDVRIPEEVARALITISDEDLRAAVTAAVAQSLARSRK